MRHKLFFLSILFLGIILNALKLPLLPFDSDQAIVGLMGKHILEGAFPWLYYGDSYAGILEPLLVAWSFLFFGINLSSLRLIPFVFSILFLISEYQLAGRLFNKKIGLLSMLLATLPPAAIGLYSAMAYGGYIEILWLGNLILLITFRLTGDRNSNGSILLGFGGLLGGMAWWTYPISVIYLATSGVVLLIFRWDLFRRGKILALVPGFVLGSLPFWIWNGVNGFPFLAFSASAENPDYTFRLQRFFHEFYEFFNPALKSYSSLLTIPLFIGFLSGLFFMTMGIKRIRRSFRSSQGPIFLLLFFVIFCLFYIGSRFSEQNASRYLLPLYSILPISLGWLCFRTQGKTRAFSVLLTLFLLLILAWHQYALYYQYLKPTSIRYQMKLEVEERLFSFLREKKSLFAYVPEYWSAAELTFNAHERPVFALPFRDRYPLYTLRADAAQEPVFVLDGKYPASFEEMFRALGGDISREIISIYPGVKGYVVYSAFRTPFQKYQEILPLNWSGKSNRGKGSENLTFDRVRNSAWSTAMSQRPGMFFQLDLGKAYVINRLALLCAKGREWDFPTYYRVELSEDEVLWKEIASVNNQWAYLFWSDGRPFWKLRDGRMEVNFTSQVARFIRITITSPAPQPWSIGEIFVYEHKGQGMTAPVNIRELLSFLQRAGINYVYADIGLSARLTLFSGGKIKCLQDDYDITHGEGYAMRGYNGTYPYFNRLKKEVDFSLRPAFVVSLENNPSFQAAMKKHDLQGRAQNLGDKTVYFDIKPGGTPGEGVGNKVLSALYWTGTHLLEIE